MIGYPDQHMNIHRHKNVKIYKQSESPKSLVYFEINEKLLQTCSTLVVSE